MLCTGRHFSEGGYCDLLWCFLRPPSQNEVPVHWSDSPSYQAPSGGELRPAASFFTALAQLHLSIPSVQLQAITHQWGSRLLLLFPGPALISPSTTPLCASVLSGPPRPRVPSADALLTLKVVQTCRAWPHGSRYRKKEPLTCPRPRSSTDPDPEVG